MKWNLKGDIISWLFYVGKSGLVSWCTSEALINSQNRISYVFLSNASS